jgi:hypothetical protein
MSEEDERVNQTLFILLTFQLFGTYKLMYAAKKALRTVFVCLYVFPSICWFVVYARSQVLVQNHTHSKILLFALQVSHLQDC